MARPLSAARYRPLSEIVHDKLRQAISQGQLQPGQRLRQETLANQLGVSRMPVREALQRLEQEGLVEVIPHRGAVVRQPAAREFTETVQALLILERSARELAFSRLSPADLRTLRRLQRTMRDRVLAGRTEDLPELNRRFHRVLLSACRLPKLCDFIELVWNWHPQAASLVVAVRGSEALSEHDRILTALERGDLVEFHAACEHHILAAVELVTERRWFEDAPAARSSRQVPARRPDRRGARASRRSADMPSAHSFAASSPPPAE